jgi:hypothetical protein
MHSFTPPMGPPLIGWSSSQPYSIHTDLPTIPTHHRAFAHVPHSLEHSSSLPLVSLFSFFNHNSSGKPSLTSQDRPSACNRCLLNSVLLFFFLMVLRFEFRASHLLGKVLYHLSHLPTSSYFSYFSDRSSFFCPVSLNHITTTSYWLRWGSQ